MIKLSREFEFKKHFMTIAWGNDRQEEQFSKIESRKHELINGDRIQTMMGQKQVEASSQ